MTTLALPHNNLHDEDATVIAALLEVCASTFALLTALFQSYKRLTSVDLRGNHIGVAGAKAIGDALTVTLCLLLD